MPGWIVDSRMCGFLAKLTTFRGRMARPNLVDDAEMSSDSITTSTNPTNCGYEELDAKSLCQC